MKKAFLSFLPGCMMGQFVSAQTSARHCISFCWEPGNTWEKIIDDKGQARGLIVVYDEVSRQFPPGEIRRKPTPAVK